MSVMAANPQAVYREIYASREQQQQRITSSGSFLFLQTSPGIIIKWAGRRRRQDDYKLRRELRVEAFWSDLSRPTSVEMESIDDSDQLDRILSHARELNQPILIDWMAAWCRKCIYLKPKLEKLAAEFDTKIKFYYVDVNKVPQSLVKRGNISKMPTIQVWKDGEKKDEVIGGHKAWLVIDEVREMIQKFV